MAKLTQPNVRFSLIEDGIITALITPFQENNSRLIDYETIKQIIEKQKEANIKWICLSGSTAETHCLTDDEWKELIEFGVKHCHENGIKVLVGTGTNCTQTTIERTTFAQEHKADACMLGCPYYNKPTQRMLEAHFNVICTGFPDMAFMLCNNPGRTGVDLNVETAVKITMQNTNVIGLKEATTDMAKYMMLRSKLPSKVACYTGEDRLLFTAIAECGFNGGMSVMSNAIPQELNNVIKLLSIGDKDEAQIIYARLEPLIFSMAVEPNPIPIKYICSKVFGCSASLRLPLLAAERSTMTLIDDVLNKLHISYLDGNTDENLEDSDAHDDGKKKKKRKKRKKKTSF